MDMVANELIHPTLIDREHLAEDLQLFLQFADDLAHWGELTLAEMQDNPEWAIYESVKDILEELHDVKDNGIFKTIWQRGVEHALTNPVTFCFESLLVH